MMIVAVFLIEECSTYVIAVTKNNTLPIYLVEPKQR